MPIHPLLFVLALILIAIFVWRGWLMADAVQGSSAYAAGKRTGTLGAVVGGPLIVFVLAAGVGAGMYFTFRRSPGAANLGAGLVLLAGVGLFGYGTYAAATRPRPAPGAQPAALSKTQALQRMIEQGQAQMRAQQDHTREQMRQGGDAARTRIAEPPAPTDRPSPRPVATEVQPPTPPSPKPAETPDTVSPGVLEALRAELAPALSDLAKDGDEAIKAASKPKRSRKDLDGQIESIAAIAGRAKGVGETLESIESLARTRLTEAGLDAGAAMAKANRFATDFKAFERRMGTRQIGRLCETSTEYLTLLRDHLGKWSIDAKGAVTTKDKALEQKLFGPMHQTRFAIDQAKDAVATLRLK